MIDFKFILNSRTPRGIYCPITNAVGPPLRSKKSGPYLTALAESTVLENQLTQHLFMLTKLAFISTDYPVDN